MSVTDDMWFSTGILITPTNETDRHDLTAILLNVALDTQPHLYG